MTRAGSLGVRDYLLLALLSLAVLAPGISSIPPVDRDESRYAVASTQMLTSGDFVDIRFQELPRYQQPAGIYWLQSAAVAAVSSPEAREIWAFRLPSLLGAVAAVLLTGWMGAVLFGRNVGIATAVLLAVSFSLGFEARSAKTDAVLLATIAAAQIALLRIYLQPDGPRWRAALFWAALGAGMMVKGPLILLFCGLTILALVAWDRRAGWLKGLHVAWGLPLFGLIVLPWYVAIGLVSDGDFYARAVGKNLLGKVGESQESHAGPPGYYLGVFTLTFWPGSLFAAFAIPTVWRRRAEARVRFLVAWIVPAWLVFELIATKLPHYVVPTYPAIACLAAVGLFAPMGGGGKVSRVLAAVYGVLWLAASALLAALGPVMLWQMEQVVSPLAVTLGVAAFALSAAVLWFVARRRAWPALASAAAAAALVWLNTYGAVLPRLDSFWMTPRIVRAVDAAQPCPDTTLVTTTYREPSLVFLHGPDRLRMANTPAEAAGLVGADPACALALVEGSQAQAFAAAAGSAGLAVRPVGAVSGVNYSDGEDLDLVLYAARDAGENEGR